MRATSRAVRNLAAVLLAAGLVAGTVIWQRDDTWPLAQMRMFPGGPESDIVFTVIKARLANGDVVRLSPSAFHLKLSDIEGQMRRVVKTPRMLGDLLDRYNEHARPEQRLVLLQLLRRQAVKGPQPPGPRPHIHMAPPPGYHWIESEIVRWP